MRFIGDVHGKMDRYLSLVVGADQSIQVGDFGAGFVPLPQAHDSAMDPARHRFIRGNHDNPAVCAEHPAWIPDGTAETLPSGTRIFYLGGATSVDRHSRVEGVEWWPDEELSIAAGYAALDTYEAEVASAGRPFDVVVTHECPESIARVIFKTRRDKLTDCSRTRQLLDGMLASSAPKTWIFGHWHTDIDTVIDGTRYICLAELSHIDLAL